MKIKNQAMALATATLALSMSASSLAAFQLVTNGDFEASWGHGTFADAGGSSTSTETTGGNGGGFGLASNVGGGWGAGACLLCWVSTRFRSLLTWCAVFLTVSKK